MLLVLAAAVVPLGARPAAAIAHGQEVAGGRYGFTVRLTMTGLPAAGGGTRESWCSGALIAPRWVITAGHCFRDRDGRRVGRTVARRTTATIGRTDLGSRAGHEVTVVAVHQSDTADVALAELGTAVTDVVPLPVGPRPPAPGEVVRLTGYGLTGAAETTPPRRLRTGQFTVDRVGDSLLEVSGRAPRADTSPCRHDSGGPFFREHDGAPELVAVVSTGPGCPHPGADFSARTDNLAGWIAATTGPGTGISARTKTGIGGGVLLLLLTTALAAVPLRRAARRRGPSADPGGGRTPIAFGHGRGER